MPPFPSLGGDILLILPPRRERISSLKVLIERKIATDNVLYLCKLMPTTRHDSTCMNSILIPPQIPKEAAPQYVPGGKRPAAAEKFLV